MFDAWGPFTLEADNANGFAKFWELVSAAKPSLPAGVGVYVAFASDPGVGLKPWYVGQTYDGFEKRFRAHRRSRKFSSLLSNGPASFYFLAIARRRKSPGKDRLDRKYIDWLEVDLIDTCLKINKQLENVQHAKFLDRIWVGGYRGENATTGEDAYVSLARLLKRK